MPVKAGRLDVRKGRIRNGDNQLKDARARLSDAVDLGARQGRRSSRKDVEHNTAAKTTRDLDRQVITPARLQLQCVVIHRGMIAVLRARPIDVAHGCG
jgi:hypothetical protein